MTTADLRVRVDFRLCEAHALCLEIVPEDACCAALSARKRNRTHD